MSTFPINFGVVFPLGLLVSQLAPLYHAEPQSISDQLPALSDCETNARNVGFTLGQCWIVSAFSARAAQICYQTDKSPLLSYRVMRNRRRVLISVDVTARY